MRSVAFAIISVFTLIAPCAAADNPMLVVPIGRSALLTTDADMVEVMVANPAIADLYVHNPTRLSIYGKMLGQTSVRAVGRSGEVLKQTDIVVTYDLPGLRKALFDAIPEEAVAVELAQNNQLLLRGTVSRADVAAQAEKIVSAAAGVQVPGSAVSVLNMLQVGVATDKQLPAADSLPTVADRMFLDSVGLAKLPAVEGPVGFMVD